jgi:hypothetical protein
MVSLSENKETPDKEITDKEITDKETPDKEITDKEIPAVKKDISFKEQLDVLNIHMLTNYPFYIITIICIFILSRKSTNKRNYLVMLLSLVYIAFAGYFIHIISHNIHYTEMYDNHPVIYKNVAVLDKCIRGFTWFLDFHHISHHNSEINKQPKYQLLEAINNFVMQGAIGVCAGTLYNMMDWRMFIFWGVFYASFHIINYTYCEPAVHSHHHQDINSNYGIDIFDILMGTKHDWTDVENYNHYSFNMIIITVLFYFII